MKRLFLFITSIYTLSLLITTTACRVNVRTLSLSEESFKKIREFNSKFQFQLKTRVLCVENPNSKEAIKNILKEKIISIFKDINKTEANNHFNLDEDINFQVFFEKNKLDINKYKINMVRRSEYILEFEFKNLEYKIKEEL